MARLPLTLPYDVSFWSGFDYGVFVIAFIDLISIRATGWTFTQGHARHFRDKYLLSLLTGRIVHFPHTLTGECREREFLIRFRPFQLLLPTYRKLEIFSCWWIRCARDAMELFCTFFPTYVPLICLANPPIATVVDIVVGVMWPSLLAVTSIC